MNQTEEIYCQVWTTCGSQTFSQQEWLNVIGEYRRGKYNRLKGIFHRTDGPAILYSNGSYEWRRNGIRHRVDGPACMFGGALEFKEWWLNGKYISDYDVEKWLLENQIDLKTIEGQTAFVLWWS